MHTMLRAQRKKKKTIESESFSLHISGLQPAPKTQQKAINLAICVMQLHNRQKRVYIVNESAWSVWASKEICRQSSTLRPTSLDARQLKH